VGPAWATDPKSGEDYCVPLNAEALAILRALPRTSRWVFPSETGDSPLDSCNWYKRVFKPACERAAVRYLRFHDLRHTFASWLAMTGAQQKVIQTLLGHKTSAMTDRHTHLSAHPARRSIAWELPPLLPPTMRGSPQTRRKYRILQKPPAGVEWATY